MITLRTSLLSDNLGFNGEDIQVKTVSAAWNKIREIRNTTEPHVLEGTILTIELPEGETSNRIPEKILFKMNTKGKMEFKELSKVQARQEKKEAKLLNRPKKPSKLSKLLRKQSNTPRKRLNQLKNKRTNKYYLRRLEDLFFYFIFFNIKFTF